MPLPSGAITNCTFIYKRRKTAAHFTIIPSLRTKQGKCGRCEAIPLFNTHPCKHGETITTISSTNPLPRSQRRFWNEEGFKCLKKSRLTKF